MVLVWLLVAGALYIGFSRWEAKRQLQRAPFATATGDLVIPRAADGHFRLGGSVNGHAVEFLVDTGASLVTVSDAFAQRIGLPSGERVTFQTANGPRPGRILQGIPVMAGHLAVGGAAVGVGLDTGSDVRALLGQSFLSQFDIEVNAKQMVLRLRRP